MGKIISENPGIIIPSQDFIKINTVKFIIDCILKGELDKLPPAPIIRKSPAGNGYIAIDGHNILVVKHLLKEKIDLYLAESKEDYLTKEIFPNNSDESIENRNKDLSEKFDSCLIEVEKAKFEGICNISDLTTKNYNLLKNPKIPLEKQRLLMLFCKFRYEYLEDIPSEKLLPGMPNYHYYKCRTNFFHKISMSAITLNSFGLIKSPKAKKEYDIFKEFLGTIVGTKRRYTKEDISIANRFLDCIIEELS